MSDQGPDDEKPKGLDISRLVTNKGETEPSVAGDLTRDRLKQLEEGGGLGAAERAAKPAKGRDPSAIETHIMGQSGAARAQALAESSVADRLRSLDGGSDTTLSRISAGLAASYSALDQRRRELEESNRIRPQENLTISNIRIPENPLIETNKRLESIEKLFGQIANVSENSAKVTFEIQLAAAEILKGFKELQKDFKELLKDFKEAVSNNKENANKNEEAAADGIKLAKLAILITIFTSLAPIAVNYFTPDPVAEALRQTVSGLQKEIDAIQSANAAQTQKLIEAIAASDKATAAAILEGIETLQAQAAKTPPLEEEK